MKEFQFSLEQRVTIPGEAAQGVVSGCKRMLHQDNEYDVHYLHPDLTLAHIIISEAALANAQPGEMVSKVDAEKMVISARTELLAAEMRKASRRSASKSRKKRR